MKPNTVLFARKHDIKEQIITKTLFIRYSESLRTNKNKQMGRKHKINFNL